MKEILGVSKIRNVHGRAELGRLHVPLWTGIHFLSIISFETILLPLKIH